MSSSRKVIIVVALGTLTLLAALMPMTLMLLPNPVPVRVGNVANQLPGIYVAGSTSTYHLFPHAEPADSFPVDSLVVDPAAQILVRYKGLSALDQYQIYSYSSGQEVATDQQVAEKTRVLTIRPLEPLPPGQYFAEVAREGTFGGTDYVYFAVTQTRTGSSEVEAQSEPGNIGTAAARPLP